MKTVKNISLANHVFSINIDAFTILEKYLFDIENFFEKNPDQKDILEGIEEGISEKFIARKKNKKFSVDINDVRSVISEMGEIDDFIFEEEKKSSDIKKIEFLSPFKSNNFKKDKMQKFKRHAFIFIAVLFFLFVLDSSDNHFDWVIFPFLGWGVGLLVHFFIVKIYSEFSSEENKKKQLFRDLRNKVIAGVCSGLGNYFIISPVIIRLFFGIAFIVEVSNSMMGAYPPFMIIGLYLFLWIAIPRAKTKENFYAMRGEKVSLESIVKENDIELEYPQSKALKTIIKYGRKILGFILIVLGTLSIIMVCVTALLFILQVIFPGEYNSYFEIFGIIIGNLNEFSDDAIYELVMMSVSTMILVFILSIFLLMLGKTIFQSKNLFSFKWSIIGTIIMGLCIIILISITDKHNKPYNPYIYNLEEYSEAKIECLQNIQRKIKDQSPFLPRSLSELYPFQRGIEMCGKFNPYALDSFFTYRKDDVSTNNCYEISTHIDVEYLQRKGNKFLEKVTVIDDFTVALYNKKDCKKKFLRLKIKKLFKMIILMPIIIF